MSDERDCSEGCDGDHTHKWHIEPHPNNSDFDVLIEDDDDAAYAAAVAAVEEAFDQILPGEERVIKIRLNKIKAPSAEVKS